MEIFALITVFFYAASTAGYIAYLFLQKNHLHEAGCYLLAAGFFCHSMSIGHNLIESGHLPIRNLYEILSLTGWMTAGVFLVFQYQFKLRIMGVYAAPLITLITIVSLQFPKEPAQAKNVLNTFWTALHVIVILMGEASFALACGAGMLYLIQEYSIKSKSHGFFFKRLPSLELLDTAGHACIAAGFAMLTLGLISGFLYAKVVWGKMWSWDPKEVWSGIAWMLYAAILHGRLSLGWRGRKSAIMAVLGFAVLLFTFLGVNFLMKGHHGEFTRW